MDYIEKEALSVPEAVFAAARALGIDERDAQVQVLSAPGARRVRVRVAKQGVALPNSDAAAPAPAEVAAPRQAAAEPVRHEKPVDYAPQASVVRVRPSGGQMEELKVELEALLAKMGTPATVELKDSAGNAVLNIASPKDALLIGRRGAGVEALNTLMLEFAHTRLKDPSLYFVVDVADYLGRQDARLVDKAKEVAARVLESGQEEVMGNLSPAERRIVHMTLKEMAGVESFSVGQGSTKKLVVQKK